MLAMISLFAITTKTEAQASFSPTTYNPTSTITDTGIDTLNYMLSGNYNKQVGIQIAVTKATGTAAGTARLYGSLFNSTGTWIPVGDTLTLSNVSVNTHYWTLTEPTYRYLRILVDGGTTVSATAAAKIIGIKPN